MEDQKKVRLYVFMSVEESDIWLLEILFPNTLYRGAQTQRNAHRRRKKRLERYMIFKGQIVIRITTCNQGSTVCTHQAKFLDVTNVIKRDCVLKFTVSRPKGTSSVKAPKILAPGSMSISRFEMTQANASTARPELRRNTSL